MFSAVEGCWARVSSDFARRISPSIMVLEKRLEHLVEIALKYSVKHVFIIIHWIMSCLFMQTVAVVDIKFQLKLGRYSTISLLWHGPEQGHGQCLLDLNDFTFFLALTKILVPIIPPAPLTSEQVLGLFFWTKTVLVLWVTF